mgnify:FL=1|tara:strand:+ start:3724 stop:9396 length:5673 start_codon:yes stop_codon:yes gene_type:complete
MSSCLVISQEELKAYKDLGVSLHEVTRDYLETGVLRSPMAISHKVKVRANNTTDIYFESKNNAEEFKTEAAEFDNRTAESWLSQLSASLKVKSEVVSKEIAKEIHASKGIIYANETAFFADGTVYFIEGTLTPESVVHEFSHPLIKSLDTTTRDRLFEEVSEEIKDQVKALYKDEILPESFKEEVLVRELTKLVSVTENTPELKTRLDKILYQIKQMLRRLIGKKVNVKDLKADTTLKQLADMLAKGDVLSLQEDLIISADVIEHFKAENDFYEFFDQIDNKKDNYERTEVQDMIDDVMNAAQNQKKAILNNPEFFPLQQEVINSYDTGSLDVILNKLGKESTVNSNQVITEMYLEQEGELVLTLDQIHERMSNYVYSLYKIKELMKVTEKELEGLTELDSKDKIDRLINHKSFIVSWGEQIKRFYDHSLGQDLNNPVKKLADDLKSTYDLVDSKINEITTDALEDVMFELLEGPAKNAREAFEKGLAYKKSRTKNQEVIDGEYMDFYGMTEGEFNKYKKIKEGGLPKTAEYRELNEKWLAGLDFDRSKAREIIKGMTQDAGNVNSFLESTSMNTDPIISSVQKHIQQMTATFEINAASYYADFMNTVLPHLEKTDGQFQTRGSLGEDMGHKEKKGVVKDDGTVEMSEEWAFLSEWQDYQYDHVVLKNDVKNAYKEYNDTNSELAKEALYKAQYDLLAWEIEYMNQEFDSNYYKADLLLLKDDTGIEASERLKFLYEDIARLTDDNPGDINKDQIKAKKLAIKKLGHFTDTFGNPKTGLDLAVAERIQEYSEARKEYFIQDEIPDAFQDAYNDQHILLVNKGIKPTTDKDNPGEYEEHMEKWLDENTRSVLKNSVYKRKQELIDEKSEILALLNEENKKIFDDTSQQILINEQTNAVKDNGNQPNGGIASAEIRDKVRIAQEEIDKLRENAIGLTGLTKIEKETRNELNAIWEEDGKRWLDPDNKAEYDALIEKELNMSNKLGLSSSAIKRIEQIDEELNKMSDTLPSDYYNAEMVELLREGDGETEFLKYMEEVNDEVYETADEAEGTEILDFLNSKEGKELIDKDSNLKKFVEQNHVYKNGYVVPTKLWQVAQSTDPFDYNTKRLRGITEKGTTDKSKDLGLIMIRDTYRVPSSEFFVNVMKDKYVTKKVVGETVNNKDQFLPKKESSKRYENAKYEKLKTENPDKFEFMEDLKKVYLQGQEGANNNDKRYLSFPKTEKTRLENIRTGNFFKFLRRLREFIYGREDDVLEFKTAEKNSKKDWAALRSYSLISTDVGMPVIGTYEGGGGNGPKVNIQDISTDVLKTIPEYIASLKHKQGAQEANNYSRMMLDVVRNTAVSKRSSKTQQRALAKQNSNSRMSQTYKKKGVGEQVTAKALNALIERDLDGIHLTGLGSDYKRLQKVLSATTKRASKINFNWNLSSGIVNYGQIKVTSLTHALSADEINPVDGAFGEVWAMKTAAEVSLNIRKRSHKTLNEQMFNLFDAISGRAMDTMGDSLSRTMMGDALDGKATQKMRKWLELQGTLQNFGAMMHKKKVTITDKNGNVKTIPYINAFELVDGLIQTKEGVQAEFAVRYDKDGNAKLGQKFLDQRLYMQNVIMKWNGAFAKKDAPLISRFIVAKQLMFLKKHVIPIASKQYSFGRAYSSGRLPTMRKRMNWTTGKAEWGHTIAGLRYLYRIIPTKGANILATTKAEKVALMYTFIQIFIGRLVIPMLYDMLSIVHGDGEDDEGDPNWQAMKSRSGYMEGFGTVDQDTYYFQEKGWLLNHASMVMRKLGDEYNSVNWLSSSTGVKDALGQASSRGIGITQMSKYAKDIISMFDGQKEQTPQKDSGGPYYFEQADAESALNFIPGVELGGNVDKLVFNFFGMNSKFLDPTKAQKNYIAGKNMQ